MRVSTPAVEGRFQAAKWLKIGAFLSAEELEALLHALGPLICLPLSGLVALADLPLSPPNFVSAYRTAVSLWGEGEALRPFNAQAWTRSLDAVWLAAAGEDRYLVRLAQPCVQVQVHHMTYSPIDHAFRPMVFGSDAIFWGLQWSFPQVYQDPKTQEFVEKPTGPNAELFQQIRRWMREFTLATPMSVAGKRVNLPMRLGRACFPWINEHPHLKARGLRVLELSHVC